MPVSHAATALRGPARVNAPIKRLPTISRPVIQAVLMKVGKSSVDESVSAKPNGNIGGIHPVRGRTRSHISTRV